MTHAVSPVLLMIDRREMRRAVAKARKRLLDHLSRDGGLMDVDQDKLEAGVDAHLERLVLAALGLRR